MKNIKTKRVLAYNIWDFLAEYDAAIAEGYVRSDLNEYFPVAFPAHFEIILIREDEPVVIVSVDNVVVPETPKAEVEVTPRPVAAKPAAKPVGRPPAKK